MTGFTMNLIPNKKVIKTEKFPIVDEESKLETKLPITVNNKTAHIIILPFLTSRFFSKPNDFRCLFCYYKVYSLLVGGGTTDEERDF